MGVSYFNQDTGSSAVPLGSIIRFPYAIGAAAGAGNVWGSYPSGYLPCDGRVLNKADYPDLAELVADAAGVPLNTDGAIILAGDQVSSGTSLTWDSQNPKNVRFYDSKLMVMAGTSIMYSNDKGTSWNACRTLLGTGSTFKSSGSPVLMGTAAYVGGANWLNAGAGQSGTHIYKFPLDGSTYGSVLTGTIGAGGVQTTVMLGAKSGTLYVYISSGTESGKIFKSINDGVSWTYVRTLASVATSINIDSIWYVAARGVFVFNATGGTYEIADFEAASVAALATANSTVTGVTFDGVYYWYTSGGVLYRTTNFVTIDSVGTALPAAFNGYVSIADGKIFVGGNTGHYSTDSGTTWGSYIPDGGFSELPFGVDSGKSLFGLINRGDDASTDLYKLKLASFSGTTFTIPTLASIDGEYRCIKVTY